jgi:uncharacterized protein (DUF488 family)
MSEFSVSTPCLFTIGHSDHELAHFVSLLARHGVNAIVDVRSQPYSRFHGQFNRETVAEVLRIAGIEYLFLGRELGARRIERESYRKGQARYDLIRGLPAFAVGLNRLRQEACSRRICLLCAEKDPITCHRTILVCRYLRGDAIDIRHILDDGSTETTEQAETRLLDSVGLPTANLFQDRFQLVEEAYDIQAERIAYTESEASQVLDGVRL